MQADIKRTMHMFEEATKLVSIVDMFSDNESFEEVATENIKYFLLPALLGKLTTKICGNDDRMHLVKVVEVYFVDFLKRLKTYGVIDTEVPDLDSTEDEAGDNVSSKQAHSPRMLEDMVGSLCVLIVIKSISGVHICSTDKFLALGNQQECKTAEIQAGEGVGVSSGYIEEESRQSEHR